MFSGGPFRDLIDIMTTSSKYGPLISLNRSRLADEFRGAELGTSCGPDAWSGLPSGLCSPPQAVSLN